MAAELWDKAWRDGWQAKYAVKEWKDGKDGKKGRYWFSRVGAKKGVALVEGRNAGGPEAPKGEATAAVDAALAEVKAQNEQTAAPAADTGEAPGADMLTAIRAAVKELAWKKSYAIVWLRNNFGVPSLDALSERQAADALQLLTAAKVDDNDVTYGEVRAKLIAEGRVRGARGQR